MAKVTLVPVVSTGAGAFVPLSVTRYLSIAEKSPFGAFHVTVTVCSPASAVTSVGASGSLSGVLSAALDSFDQPTSFFACTLNV